MRVLVVEDVQASQMTSPKACRGEAMAVDVVYDGLEAIIKLDREPLRRRGPRSRSSGPAR